ncbi:adducin 1-like protein hts isoform X2 [Anticarsia gemmatalis]|uniref:adducin 1-like protein hts isoform X2 n=1 Tax=Anticarsia gemmatalis TaxID=129554 RepID=UPI003F758FAD
MADTDTETLPNGTGALSNEEEDERLKQRPADIDADVREMERRKRVEALMSSKLFREELERVLDQQMHEGNDAPLLQRIREMVGGRLHTGSLRGPACVLPINDIRGIEGVGYEKGEKILRCKLAAVYRLVDLFGWTQTGITGQITARLNTAVESVLTTPRGLLPHEVTASSLVKVDMQGAVQDQGTTNFPVNVEGFSLHASVHAARPDIRCVLHVRSPGALAVSAMKRGLLPLCHEAALLGDIAYHRVPNGPLDNSERDKLVRALGPSAKVLVLTSAGALCCGATLEEAFLQARCLAAAADVQLRLAAVPLDDLALIDEETRRQMYEMSRKPPSDAAKWRVGGEEFEALMRMLDNAGFRTGYIYRHPLIKNDVPRPKNDVEVPPAVSSLGYLLEEEELYKQGLWKKGQGKTGERTRWLNSPNVYQKVEVLETGTSDPKKITKWVQDGSPAHSSTPVKIDTLQFVPKNTNPKEFKQLQQQIKENRRADKISAGPQSHILEGVTWDEASKLIGEDAANTHTGDHVVSHQVLMGAASKGIIQRGYQHNATVYSAPYARNPFDHVTDNEIDEYKRIVERKQRPNEYDTDLSESEAISAAQITSPASAPSETEEESRDEHRVLRIETKQAPVRSQPEVVLSDVDTTDFLNAERAHADRTKVAAVPGRDPNLLSDDEVFLDSPASPLTSSGVTSPVQHVVVRAAARDRQPISDDEVLVFNSYRPPPQPVVISSHHAAVQQTVARAVTWFRQRRFVVLTHSEGEHTVNGDHSDAHQSTFSHSSKEGSPSKEVSTEDSPKKDKKKKKGLRTPSFLKKKKEKKKTSTPQPA